MTLRKCIFESRNILNGVVKIGTTTGFINRPLNCTSGAFYISTRITHGLLKTAPLKKSVTQRVGSNLVGFSCKAPLSLAIGFNLIWKNRELCLNSI